MRHLSNKKTFHRGVNQRRALIKHLLAALITKGQIETTTAKAKYLRARAEKLVTLARKQNVATLRLLQQRLPKQAAGKLYYEIAPRFKDRPGGYTRIIKSPLRRKGDTAELSTISFLQ